MHFDLLWRDSLGNQDKKAFDTLRFALRSALRRAGVEETEVLVFEHGIHILTVKPDLAIVAGTERTFGEMQAEGKKRVRS